MIFLYVAFMLGDRAATGAPFYVTSKVRGEVIFFLEIILSAKVMTCYSDIGDRSFTWK